MHGQVDGESIPEQGLDKEAAAAAVDTLQKAALQVSASALLGNHYKPTCNSPAL